MCVDLYNNGDSIVNKRTINGHCSTRVESGASSDIRVSSVPQCGTDATRMSELYAERGESSPITSPAKREAECNSPCESETIFGATSSNTITRVFPLSTLSRRPASSYHRRPLLYYTSPYTGFRAHGVSSPAPSRAGVGLLRPAAVLRPAPRPGPAVPGLLPPLLSPHCWHEPQTPAAAAGNRPQSLRRRAGGGDHNNCG